MQVNLDKLVDKWAGSIEIGVTTNTPNELEFPSTMTNVRSGTWMMTGNGKSDGFSWSISRRKDHRGRPSLHASNFGPISIQLGLVYCSKVNIKKKLCSVLHVVT